MSADEFNKSYSAKHSAAKPGFNANTSANNTGYQPDNKPHYPPTSSVGEDSTVYNTSKLEPLDNKHSFNIIGEAMKTYIILEENDSLRFIDKHAAHERIHFNALKSDGYEPMSQALLVPVVCRFGTEDASVLLDNEDFLDKLGFSVESFGEDSVAVRRIPSEIDLRDTEIVLSEICEHLKHGNIADSERLDSIFRTLACGSSITAGSSSSAQELEALATRVLSGEITHCPHGRPVMFELTKKELDKRFGRL